MTAAKQEDVLQYFKDGEHKLIVATSVAEEGLDVRKCNIVIRYEHVTNTTARIQARGNVLFDRGIARAEREGRTVSGAGLEGAPMMPTSSTKLLFYRKCFCFVCFSKKSL